MPDGISIKDFPMVKLAFDGKKLEFGRDLVIDVAKIEMSTSETYFQTYQMFVSRHRVLCIDRNDDDIMNPEYFREAPESRFQPIIVLKARKRALLIYYNVFIHIVSFGHQVCINTMNILRQDLEEREVKWEQTEIDSPSYVSGQIFLKEAKESLAIWGRLIQSFSIIYGIPFLKLKPG
jgi:hypothetical protein